MAPPFKPSEAPSGSLRSARLLTHSGTPRLPVGLLPFLSITYLPLLSAGSAEKLLVSPPSPLFIYNYIQYTQALRHLCARQNTGHSGKKGRLLPFHQQAQTQGDFTAAGLVAKAAGISAVLLYRYAGAEFQALRAQLPGIHRVRDEVMIRSFIHGHSQRKSL